MSTKINVAGVWKSPTPKINVAGTWKAPTIKINVAGTWKQVYSPLSVNIAVNGRLNVNENATCYSGAYFLTSGTQYEYLFNGNGTSLGAWLLAGSNSEVWVMWTRTGGTLSDWNNLGGGNNNVRLQLSTSRYYRLNRTATGYNDIIGYFRMYDAASGGNLLDTGPTGTYRATYEFNGCPLCCFTPDTLVTMASGIEVPIGKVRKGDKILIKRPEDGAMDWEKVGEVITVQNRRMFKLYFEDGTILKASDDHPLHVPGKGYAAVNPAYEYKDMGIPEKLEVGDAVTTIRGPSARIVKIEEFDYPLTVFTFSNSFWFANGKLVY